MSKYRGKVLTLYIAPSGVRVVEGENKNGSPHISRFFTVGGVFDFFSPVPGSMGAFEVSNMSGLVAAIVDECKNRQVTCRKVMITSNCFGLNTAIKMDTNTTSIKDILFGDLEKRKKKPKSKDDALVPGTLRCKINWGNITDDGVVKKVFTHTIGDKFVTSSLVREFYRNGYEVISISDNVGSFINFRQTEEATFDSKGKIVVDLDESAHVLVMCQDLPVYIDLLTIMDEEDIPAQVESTILRFRDRTGRNPKIYLTGSKLQNTELYNDMISDLEDRGHVVYDMFDRPKVDPATGKAPLTGADVLTADYSANIAMFMATYAKNIVSIVPPLGFSEIFRQNSKAISTVVLVCSIIIFGVAGVISGMRFFKLQYIENNPPQISSLESNLAMLNSDKKSLQSTLDTLTKADSVVIDLMEFIVANQSEMVSIVSMDTMDMLEDPMSVDGTSNTAVTVTTPDGDSTSESPEDSTLSGSSGGSTKIREDIVIRGYARTGNAAISYYNKLFNSGLPVDPVLNGVEKYALPNGEEVYVFEIKVGGAEG